MPTKTPTIPSGCELVANVPALAARCGISKSEAGQGLAFGSLRPRFSVPGGMIFESATLDDRRKSMDAKLSARFGAEFHAGQPLFSIRLGAHEMRPFAVA